MRCAIFLMCFCLLIPLVGCRSVSSDRSDQWTFPFCASVAGARGELSFAADLSVSDGEKTIRYTAPDTLNGLAVTETADGIRICFDGLEQSDRSDVSELLLPLRLLTAPEALSSLQTRNGETILTYADGTKIVLDEDGSPREVSRADIRFTVLAFSVSTPPQSASADPK